MPAKQADQVEWSRTFVAVVSPVSDEYGLTKAEMGGFEVINAALQTAWSNNADPATRSRTTVSAKNTALKAMKAKATDLVRRIQGTATVTDTMKVMAGVTVYKTTRTPSSVPRTSPFISAKPNGRSVLIELQKDRSKRGKPAGVQGATIFTHVGPTAPQSMDDWKFMASSTTTTVEIPFGPSATGDTVWITAFWKNTRDESGPATPPISINLPAGGVLPKEVGETIKLAA